MEHYVTLFNSLFLPQGIALHMSMERHVRDYVLWILCVDDETYDVLTRLVLPCVRLLKLSDLETDELRAVKPTRTIGEYCWTLTPFAPRFVFEADASVDRVTYLDADLWFLRHPKVIFDELLSSNKEVLITEHSYAPGHDASAKSGRFCVQFMIFNRKRGELVRKWWESRCIEWCFARFEEGKFGDQKYLDDWPNRFSSLVHVLRDRELTLGPWNVLRLPIDRAVFYHFHDLRIISNRKLQLGPSILPTEVLRQIYKPYCRELRRSEEKLAMVGFKYLIQARSLSALRRIRLIAGRVYRLYLLLRSPVIIRW